MKKKATANRIVMTVLLISLFAGLFCINVTVPAYADSGVKIGQATNGEGGSLRGCRAGDQSGGEVSISGWTYGSSSGSPFHWKYVLRAKDPEVGRKLAEAMKAAAANDHVGYDQDTPDRYSFFEQAERVNWDISAISKNCETTCASAISVCCNAAGIRTPKLLYSEIVYEELMKIPGVVCQKPGGAFYLTAKLPVDDVEDFLMFLLTEFEDNGETVMFAPAAGFYATPGLGKDEMRIAYVLKQEDMRRGTELIKLGLEAYNKKLGK